ncbi:MAG TPA: hypothetical protein VNU19_08125 [Candidatus Acidoferrum sp.]|jgi:hypothetical protein|nr:hypothetical protein [Candidatus Acidoferrum sp.]
MYNPYSLQLAKDRQSALLREAQNESLAKLGTRDEPLVKLSFTVELRLRGRNHQFPSPVLSPDPCP